MKSREEYVSQLKSQLDQWNAEVSRWEGKAQEAQTALRDDCDRRLGALRVQRDQALQHMRRVQSASGDAWRDLVLTTDDAWAKLREAFDKARSHWQK